ncbi:MAG: alpha-D-ribose 1-methylphosphonate 5-triphosphate diphosphatase [Sulfitobacter sp.]
MTHLEMELSGAEVLFPEGFARESLSIAGGLITSGGSGGAAVDLRGYRIVPGIVDLHGDGFERHLAPRRGAMKQMAEGLVATEAELAANGITTGILAQFISWEGGIRGAEYGARVFETIRDTGPELVTDLRGQLRLEMNMLELYADLPAQMAQWGVEYIVFNDHLPHERLAAGKQPPRLVSQALRAGRSPETHLALMQSLHEQRSELPDALDWLCPILAKQGVRMGSHDDNSAEGRAAWRARGVQIAEFPETAEAAEHGGDPVILGAPNVVRGGSHKHNVSAIALIMMGYCDALASDYHYPSPRRAALMLAESGVMDFASAWGLISAGPARILGLEDRGVIAPGKRADLAILDSAGRVAATLAGGRVSYMAGDVAQRFMR